MQNILNIITANIEGIILGMLLVMLVMLIWLIVVNSKLNHSVKHYRSLMRGMKDRNLEEILNEHLTSVKFALERIDEVELSNKRLENIAKACFQRMSVKRFNAFENTGSDLSYAVALLDMNGNGVILSSIYGRDESRTYAKPIVNGKSKYHLSGEEEEVLGKALVDLE